MNKTKINFWNDFLIFTLFLITAGTGMLFRFALLPAQEGWTWEAVHSWTGGAMLAFILLHLVLHWKWIITIAGRFLKKTSRQARINFCLDLLLFGVFTLICLSGLVNAFVLADLPARQGSTGQFWYTMHRNTGTVFLVYVGVHLSMHWKWIRKMLKDLLEGFSERQKSQSARSLASGRRTSGHNHVSFRTGDRRSELTLNLRRDNGSKRRGLK